MRTRLAAWNVGGNLLYTAVTLVVGLAASPLLVRWLGTDRFGAARTMAELYGHLGLLELGLAGTIGPLLASALNRDDTHDLRHTLSAGVRAYLVLTLPVLLVGLALTGALDSLIWLPKASDRADLHAGWLLGLIGWLSLPLIPMRALVEAGQRGYKVSLLMTGQSLLIVGLSLLLARGGWGLKGQSLALAAGTLSLALALAIDASKRHPGLIQSISTTRPDRTVRRAIWALSGPTLIFNVGGRLGLLTDSLILSALRGPGLVSSLYFTQRLAVLAQLQLQGVGNACWAGLAEIDARGERDLFNRRLIELTRMVAVLGVAVLAPIVAYDRAFLDLWLRERAEGLYAGQAVVFASAANALMLGLISLWGWCFSGTGRVGKIVAPVAVGSALNVAVSLAAAREFGAVGPLLGTTTAFVTIYAWALPLQLRRHFGTPLVGLALAVLLPVALGVPYLLGLRAFVQAHRPPGWIELGAEMALSAALYLVVAGRLLLSPTDRAVWKGRLAGLVSRKVPDSSSSSS